MSVLTTTRHTHTLFATINRPKAHNAINFAVMDALEALLDDLEEDSDIRCFILRGAGKDAFISGGDLKEFHTIKTAAEAGPMARRMTSILQRMEMLPCWSIACVNAPAYGGGCEIMLAFDFRIADPLASFGFTQGKFYLPPGWGGLTRLVERVGRATALRWLAECAIIDVETALDYKLIDRIAPAGKLEEKTLTWAEQLSRNDRSYIKTLKKGALKLAKRRWESIEEELEPFARFWEDDRHNERVNRFFNRGKSE